MISVVRSGEIVRSPERWSASSSARCLKREALSAQPRQRPRLRILHPAGDNAGLAIPPLADLHRPGLVASGRKPTRRVTLPGHVVQRPFHVGGQVLQQPLILPVYQRLHDGGKLTQTSRGHPHPSAECAATLNADINGAINILRKYLQGLDESTGVPVRVGKLPTTWPEPSADRYDVGRTQSDSLC